MGFFNEEIAIIAYRGASAYEKPGSKEAFRKAIELGAHGVYAELGYLSNYELVVEPEGCGLGIRDFLNFIGKDVKVILNLSQVNIKDVDKLAETVASRLKEVDDLGRLVIASSDTALLNKVKELTNVKVAAFVSNPFPNISRLRRLGVNFIVIPHSLVRARVVKEAKGRGIEVIAWLVNDPTVLLKMESLGVSAVVTERPDILREARKIG